MSYLNDGLTFSTLRQANLQRLPQFKNKKSQPAHSKKDGSDWKLTTWIAAAAGEGGEMVEALLIFKALGHAANTAKKIERGDISLEDARADLAKELADVAIYLDIVAYRAGVDLGQAVISKFNEVSRRVGSTTLIKADGSDWEYDHELLKKQARKVKA